MTPNMDHYSPLQRTYRKWWVNVVKVITMIIGFHFSVVFCNHAYNLRYIVSSYDMLFYRVNTRLVYISSK